jgi:hypothetical protein
MRQPNEYWLKYMLVSGSTQSDIVDISRLYSFTVPDRDYLRELSQKLNETKPSPFRATLKPAKAWLRRQRIMSLFTSDESAVKARTYLGNYKLRPVLEALILADTDRASIPDYCAKICGKKPSTKSVRLFEHYFWNRSLLTPSEWAGHLAGHDEGDLLLECYRRGPMYALWKLGYREEVSPDEVVKGILHESTMRYFETGSEKNSKDTAIMAKLWSEQAFRALEELGKTGDGVQQVLDELKNIAIHLEKTDISSIEALKNGKPEDE